MLHAIILVVNTMKKAVILFLFIFLLCSCQIKKQEVKIVKYCNKGTLVNDMCEEIHSIAPTNIVCEEDFTYNKETKKCERSLDIPANKRLGCDDEEHYELRGGACHPKNGKGVIKYRKYFYSCPETGKLSGKRCIFTDQQDPILTCKEGYKANVEKATCEKKVSYKPLEKQE